MLGILIAASGITGAVVGSFLNVDIDRVPAKESLLSPPSRCPACGRRLRALEMVPVISYLVLRGRCRACGHPIPMRVLGVELFTALAFALMMWVFGPSLELVLAAVATCFMVALLVMDLEGMFVYDAIVYPAIVAAVLIVVIRWLAGTPRFSHYGFLWMMSIGTALGRLSPSQLGALSQVVGGLAGLLLFTLIYVVAPRIMRLQKRGLSEAMGLGDAELGAYCGLLVGFPGIIFAAMSSFVLGGLIAGALLLLGKVTRETYVPFGPFLIVTTFIFVVFGDVIMGMYLGL